MNKTERKRQGVTVQVTLRDRQPFIPTSGRTEPNASERFSEGGEAGWKSRLVGIEPLSGQQDHSRQSVSIRGYSGQNETKRDDFTIFSHSPPAVPSTYDDSFAPCLIFRAPAPNATERFCQGRKFPALNTSRFSSARPAGSGRIRTISRIVRDSTTSYQALTHTRDPVVRIIGVYQCPFVVTQPKRGSNPFCEAAPPFVGSTAPLPFALRSCLSNRQWFLAKLSNSGGSRLAAVAVPA